VNAETKITEFAERLVTEGDAVLATKFLTRRGTPYVDPELFAQWRGRCALLLSMLGSVGEPWRQVLATESANTFGCAKSTRGAVKGIKQSLAEGLLVRFKDIVLAEVFSDISEQASYLFSQGYFLASAVIARAVLEERLRRLCAVNNCLPSRERAMINDLNQELYKEAIYDKITFKQVDALAAVGNHAAHNQPPDLKEEDVRRLLDGLQDFLQRFAV
jgi:hypothetical protein